jgi:hypothetical protein
MAKIKNEELIIKKINELYIMTRYKYLSLSKKGMYSTFNKEKNENVKPLQDYMISNHLQGKNTYGVFPSRDKTKFLCFDVDVTDENNAKWVTYKIYYSLIDFGIDSSKIYISFSGNKGYHIEVFFNSPIENAIAKEIFDYILKISELEFFDMGKVEFRPSNSNGVKLPLGKNFRNKSNKRCWFVDFEKGLKPIRTYEYLLQIKTIEIKEIYSLIERMRDNSNDIDVNLIQKNDFHEKPKNQVNPDNLNKNLYLNTLNILENGLKHKGTRHDAIFDLARYYKNEGCNVEECIESINRWFNQQDKSKYSTTFKECLRDIKETVYYVYEKDISFNIKQKGLQICRDEIDCITNLQKYNHMLVYFSLLIHSKRYSNKKGEFYMSVSQIDKMCGLKRYAIENGIEELENRGLITIVERNRSKKGTYIKDANLFRINSYVNLCEKDSNCINFEINDDTDFIKSLNEFITLFASKDKLKKTLSRRQFEKIYNKQ